VGELLAFAAPAAPVAGITAALIFACFALIVLYGLQAGYQYTLGALIRRLADAVDDIWLVGDDLADALDSLDSWVMKQIGRGLESLEFTVAKLWDGLAEVTREVGDAVVAFGLDVHDAIAGVVGGEIPTQIENRTRGIRQEVTGTRRGLDARLDAEARARSRGIDATNRDLTREELARQHGIDAINTRIGSVVLPRIRGLDRELDAVRGWVGRIANVRIRNLEQALAAGAIGAVAIAAVTRVFPYWQCTNVRRFNRFLCRSPIGALDDLLGLALVLVASISILDLARACQTATGFTATAVHDFVVED
jgi:hypothetical protein